MPQQVGNHKNSKKFFFKVYCDKLLLAHFANFIVYSLFCSLVLKFYWSGLCARGLLRPGQFPPPLCPVPGHATVESCMPLVLAAESDSRVLNRPTSSSALIAARTSRAATPVSVQTRRPGRRYNPVQRYSDVPFHLAARLLPLLMNCACLCAPMRARLATVRIGSES